MTNKTTLQRLKLDPYFSKTIETNLNVWSHDQNSYEIKFEFYDHQCDKPIDLTGADMRILLDHQGSQPKIYPLEIESKILGLAKFIMPEQIRGCEGKFTAHIYADYPNKTHDFGSFTFYTQLSRIDGDLGGCMDEIYVSEFEKALEKFKEIEDKIERNDLVTKPEMDDYFYGKPFIDSKFREINSYTDELYKTKADKTYVENELKIKADKASLINKVEVDYFNETLASIATGSPQAMFDSLEELKNNYPTGKQGVYLVKNENSADSYIYQNDTWVKIGAYPSAKLSDEDYIKIDSSARAIFYQNYAINGRPISFNHYYVNTSTGGYNEINQEINFTAKAKFGQVNYSGFSNLNLNNRIYMRVAVKHSEKEPINNIRLVCSYNNSKQVISPAMTVTDEYRYLSFIFEANDFIVDKPNFKVMDYRDTSFTEISIKHLTLIDVDKDFKGKDVNIGYLDDLFESLSYFDGVHNTNIVSRSEKADYANRAKVADSVSDFSTPIFVSFKGNKLSLVSKYNEDSDILYTFNKNGPNSLMDFESIKMIDNTSNNTSSDLSKAKYFWNNTTDCFAPYILLAKNNIDGDSPESLHFTGGRHGYLNNSSGSAENTKTARTINVSLKVDGRKVSEFNDYANSIELSWSNKIQATNTKKKDGNGREVLVENYTLTFENGVWKVEYNSEVLEDLIIKNFYGLQLDNKAWQGHLFYHGAKNMKKNMFVDTDTSCKSKKCNAMTLVDPENKNEANLSIDYDFGIGDRRFLSIEKGAFSAKYNKVYFNLINDYGFEKGDCLSFLGNYNFRSIS